jgi:hypothetical protein
MIGRIPAYNGPGLMLLRLFKWMKTNLNVFSVF